MAVIEATGTGATEIEATAVTGVTVGGIEVIAVVTGLMEVDTGLEVAAHTLVDTGTVVGKEL